MKKTCVNADFYSRFSSFLVLLPVGHSFDKTVITKLHYWFWKSAKSDRWSQSLYLNGNTKYNESHERPTYIQFRACFHWDSTSMWKLFISFSKWHKNGKLLLPAENANKGMKMNIGRSGRHMHALSTFNLIYVSTKQHRTNFFFGFHQFDLKDTSLQY